MPDDLVGPGPATLELVVIHIRSMALGSFAGIEPLNPAFRPRHAKLRVTVDTERTPRLPESDVLAELAGAFPGLARHQCRAGAEQGAVESAGTSILLVPRDASANQAHVFEHLTLEILGALDDSADRLSGVTCAYADPPERNDVFVECHGADDAPLAARLAAEVMNGLLSGRPAAPLYPDALACARLMHDEPGRAWTPHRLAIRLHVPTHRAAAALAVLSHVRVAGTTTLVVERSAGRRSATDRRKRKRIMPRTLKASILTTLFAALALAGASGCASTNKTTKGAVIGGVAGGVVGGVIGNQTGSTTRGAIIGAAVGGAAGAIIGNRMDRRAREIAQNVPAADVQRVGEGIQITFPSGLLFDFDSDVVRSNAALNLNDLARNLNNYGDSNMMIAGHTDATGSAEYNQDLSNRRAESAARYLTAHGVTRYIATAGLGEREPVGSNSTEAGRQQNRRIEIAIYASAALQEDARREAAGR